MWAYGGTDAAGIGTGERCSAPSDRIDGGSLTVNGGYVFADGTDWGAGIGGGEDAKGAAVEINGGTVIAWAGEDAGEKNGSAIGSEDGDGRRGSLKIGDSIMVHAGQTPTDAQSHLFTHGERVPACWFRPYTKIEPCTHANASFTIDGTTAEGTHTRRCPNCLNRDTEQHTFGADNKCVVCGVGAETHVVQIYLPAAVDGAYTDGNYALAQKFVMVSSTTFELPDLPSPICRMAWSLPDGTREHPRNCPKRPTGKATSRYTLPRRCAPSRPT